MTARPLAGLVTPAAPPPRAKRAVAVVAARDAGVRGARAVGLPLRRAAASGARAPPLLPCCVSRRSSLLLWLLAQPVARACRGRAERTWWCCSTARGAWTCRRASRRRATLGGRGAVASSRCAAALRGRASVDVIAFADHLGLAAGTARDSGALHRAGRSRSASWRGSEAERRASAVVVVSDGAVNAGADPVAAAQALGLPVHTVRVGATSQVWIAPWSRSRRPPSRASGEPSRCGCASRRTSRPGRRCPYTC